MSCTAMDAINAKELDSYRKRNGSYKRKQGFVTCHDACRPLKSRRTAGDSSAVAFPHGKEINFSCPSGKQIIWGYQNYISSALPLLILWFVTDTWKAFPDYVVKMVLVEFKEKKGIINVTYQAQSMLLDFVHMSCVFVASGHRAPLAWIDEHGNRYFPEMSANKTATNVIHNLGNCLVEHDNFDEVDYCSDISESVAESTNVEMHEEVSSNAKVERTVNMNASHGAHEDLGNIACKNEPFMSNSTDSFIPQLVQRKLAKALDVGPAVENMLLSGMCSLITSKDIIGIYRAPFLDSQGNGRFVLFQKNVDLIANRRGNANLRYAWLACTRDSVNAMMLNGVFQIKKPLNHPSYGIGTYLAPANCSNVCASYCDVDDNGLFHLMLCRVIMGSVEVIQPGSQQQAPSDDRFDTGVDDVRSPRHYIIWDMNVKTHIYPEFVLSIKMPSELKDITAEKVKPHHDSGHSVFGSRAQVRSNLPASCTLHEEAKSLKRVTVPSSPWMPFPVLFAALSPKVKHEIMEQVNKFYEDFKSKNISRIDLIKKLRTAVGDELMVSTIMELQEKPPSAVRRDLPSELPTSLGGVASLA